MTSVIYFVIVRTTRKPTVGVDDPPKIAGRYTHEDSDRCTVEFD